MIDCDAGMLNTERIYEVNARGRGEEGGREREGGQTTAGPDREQGERRKELRWSEEIDVPCQRDG